MIQSLKQKSVIISMAIAVGLLSLVGFAGWILGIRILTSLVPGGPTLKFNATLLIGLCTISLYMNLLKPKAWYCMILPVFIGMAGLLTLAEDVMGVRLGIDEWLIQDHFGGNLENNEPGRMATTSALAFVLLGFGFFGIRSPGLTLLAQIAFHIVTLIAFVAAMGYLVGASSLYTLSFLSAMSLPAGISFFMLSLAGAFLAPEVGLPALFAGDKLGSQVARRLFPTYLLVIVGLTALRITLHQADWVDVKFGIGLFGSACSLAGLVLIMKSADGINRADDKRKHAQYALEVLNASLEETIKARTAEIQAILDSAQVAIIATNAQGAITHFSRGAQAMLGYSEAEAQQSLSFNALHLPEEVDAHAETLSDISPKSLEGLGVFKALAQKYPDQGRLWNYVPKTGNAFPVQEVVSPILTDDGEIKGYLGVAVDVSELENTKNILQVLADKLNHKNAKLTNFAHVASHNLRAPVHNLAALMELHRESDDEMEQSLFLSKVDTVIVRLKETLDELMESLRIQEDPDVSEQKLVLQEVFASVLDQFSGDLARNKASITADFSAAPVVTFYRPYLESILTNFISNALKYRSPDRVPEVRVFSVVNADHSITLSVADNGLGIDMKQHGAKLFRINQTFHSHPEARGVGLYIVKAQTEALGGSLKVESLPGQGSVFSLVTSALNPVV